MKRGRMLCCLIMPTQTQTIGNAALSLWTVKGKEIMEAGEQLLKKWKINKILSMDPAPISLLRGQIIFSCSRLEGFTLTLHCSSSFYAPLPATSGLVKCQGCPETKNWHTKPPIRNSFRLLWLRAGGLTQSHSSACTVCCFLQVV